MRQCLCPHCTCGWGARSRYQKLCVAGLVGAQRTAQNNSNVESEPNTWLVKDLQYVLSTLELFLVLFLLSWLLRSLLFFSKLSAVGCVQHSFLHFTLPNIYIAKAQPRCPSRLPSPRNVVPTSYGPHVSVTPEFLSMSAN